MLARQRDIGQERDDGGIGKTLAEYLRRAVADTLSRPNLKTSFLLDASDTDSAALLRDAASAYTVDSNAIAVEG
jgi:ParB family transcriptional regulator, chromosome partitioning protein